MYCNFSSPDYYQRTEIDCDQVLELEEGWVLSGVHSHPTPHISIVGAAPSLPANGDHTPYLHALAERTKNKGRGKRLKFNNRTVKPVLMATSIQRPPVLRGHSVMSQRCLRNIF